ncbi:cell death regulator Aven [Lissotriton helveticus]
MERGGGGGGRGWRGGGGSRRRGGDRPPPQHADGDGPRGGGGRRGGGGQRSRGWRGGPPRGGRGGPPPSERGRVDQNDPETRDEEGEEEESGGYSFSRRKIVPNWNRYEEAEKEAQSEGVEVQRGADYSVLLSSAGDSFAQFRFADEKEWDTEQSGPKQISALHVDCQSLVLALQELPLYLRVNVEAELVQEETPLELPQMKPKVIEDSNSTLPKFGIPLYAGAKLLPSNPVKDADTDIKPSGRKEEPMESSDAERENSSLPPKEAEILEKELDLLLSLEEHVTDAQATTCKEVQGTLAPELMLKMDSGCNEEVPLTPPQAEVLEDNNVVSSAEQPTTTPKVTEEDLEDWLDSMIS